MSLSHQRLMDKADDLHNIGFHTKKSQFFVRQFNESMLFRRSTILGRANRKHRARSRVNFRNKARSRAIAPDLAKALVHSFVLPHPASESEETDRLA